MSITRPNSSLNHNTIGYINMGSLILCSYLFDFLFLHISLSRYILNFWVINEIKLFWQLKNRKFFIFNSWFIGAQKIGWASLIRY